MKRRYIISILIVLLIPLMFCVFNKTFFKTYYETKIGNITTKVPVPLFSYYEKTTGTYDIYLSTFRSVKSIRDEIGKYVEYLPSCYDESYFYDAKRNITISEYTVTDGSPFNKIHIRYMNGDYCKNEYVLEDSWYTTFLDSAIISENVINACETVNGTTNCTSKAIDDIDVKTLIKYISKETTKRVSNYNNMGYNSNDSVYEVISFYRIGTYGYELHIFKYNNNLTFKIYDMNDHGKNAMYTITSDIDQILKDIYMNN